ncbi:MAG TPA: glycosyltransferase, partial [Nitrospiraceae bacterium]|nr:glycosyltransferase [Nitrospiraceae bacterium]
MDTKKRKPSEVSNFGQLSTQDSALNTFQVSVVVPTYKRPHLLDRCLAALVAQILSPEQYEILVVDDGPTEDTRQVVESWAMRPTAPRLRYLPVPTHRGPAAARNLGWQAAQGGIVAFTDDDCIPAPEWLAAGIGPFTDRAVWAVSGRIIVPLPAAPTDWERNVAGLERAPFATANCLYRWRALSAVGG